MKALSRTIRPVQRANKLVPTDAEPTRAAEIFESPGSVQAGAAKTIRFFLRMLQPEAQLRQPMRFFRPLCYITLSN